MSDLKRKYPLSHSDPDPSCPLCKGQGEFTRDRTVLPCMCIYGMRAGSFLDGGRFPFANPVMELELRKG